MKYKQKISFLKKSQSSNTPHNRQFSVSLVAHKKFAEIFFANKKSPEFLQTKSSKFAKQKEHRNSAQF